MRLFCKTIFCNLKSIYGIGYEGVTIDCRDIRGSESSEIEDFPPKVDRLGVAGGLTPGLSEPGNKEFAGNLTV
jgi:hypothetical protein